MKKRGVQIFVWIVVIMMVVTMFLPYLQPLFQK